MPHVLILYLCADQVETSTSPPPRANLGHLNFSRLDRSNSRPLGPKWCSNVLPCRRILSVKCPPKEQSSSVPVVCNKACVHSRYKETSVQDGKLFWRLATRYTVRFRTRNTHSLVNQLRRIFLESQGTQQFISQSGFSFGSVFFLPLFTAVLRLF